jgi:cell filamentation protein
VPGYTYPGTDTLKNKLGATTHDELEEREAPYIAARHIEIEAGHGPPLQLDAEHLKALHRHLFQDVYEWAGHTRDEEVSLGDGSIATEPELTREGSRAFVAGPHIAVALDEIAAKLRDADYLGGLSRDAFAERAADLLAELNAVHPFREGNGRTQRAFVEQLAQAAGHDLDFSVISKERMIVASMAAHDQTDLGPMRRLFTDAVDPARRTALREAIEFLDRQQFPWNDRYIATVEPGHPVEVTFAGTAGDHFMARTGSQILVSNVADLPHPRPERGQAFTLDPTHAIGGAERTEANETAEQQAAIIDDDRRRRREDDPDKAREDRLSGQRTNENPGLREQQEPQEAGQPRYDRYTGQRIDDRGRSADQHGRGGGRGQSR